MSKLTAKEAVALQAKGEITLLDVREANELQSSGKAAGAVHIPLALVALKAAEDLPKGKRVAVYCAVGGRAGMAAQTLASMGYEVENIGGFGDWVAAGGAISH